MAIQTNKAKFSITGNTASPSSALGYAAVPAEALTIALEDSTGVLSVTYALYDPADLSSPLASLNAPTLLFGNGLRSQTLSGPFSATIAMPAFECDAHTWILRSTATSAGRNDVFERSLDFLNNKMRKPIPGETTQSSQRGAADSFDTFIASKPAWYFGSGQTPASVTNVIFGAMVLPRSSSVWIRSKVLAQGLGGPANATYYELDATYTVTAGGGVTLKNGPTVTLTRDLSGGAFAATPPTLALTSGTVGNSVTGIVAQAIRWTAWWDVFVAPNV